MTLPELLERYRVYTIRELSRRTGLSNQQAWNLWHGKAGLGRRNLERLHDALGIPFEELLQVERPQPAPRRGPTPRRRAPEASAVETAPEPPAPVVEAAPPAPVALTPQARKAELLPRLQQMKTAGMTLAAMAAQLNREGVPTISGRGTWKPGTIGNLLKESEA
jgi:transcriptional regulator with XRE-family HTH domain